MYSEQILVVDDNPDTLRVILQYFDEYQENYRLLNAPNGYIAYEIAGKKCPDLIIMDWDMPIMNGMEALILLKANEKTRDIPVIIATGRMTDDEHLKEALTKGAVDYLRKPFSKVELIARSRSAIQLAKYLREIRKSNVKIQALHLREKELMQDIIDHKVRELTILSAEIARKNEILSDIQKRLATSKNVSAKSVNEMVRIIKNTQRNDEYWSKFVLHFNDVHPRFFEKLQMQYPNLSDNDLKVCAYIKMKLSNKETAQLLNISYKGLETSRYRLKKKMNLNADNDLNTIIRGL